MDWNTSLDSHLDVAAKLRDAGPVLGDIADALLACVQRGGRIYIAGNGGSAADAQHIAAELIGRFKRERAAISAIALTTDTSSLTAIGNDYGFDLIFARQVEALVQKGDVFWAISTSGNSANILAAIRAARDRGATIVGFTGEAGGKMAGLCNHLFRVPHASSDRIQEFHALAYHYVCERIEASL